MVRIATLDDGGQLTPDQVPALATLGATATGEALIEAVDAAAARTALGMTAAGSAVATAADASAQRTALELGGAATLAVGTTTGTVAAGDDSRITGALPAANLDTAATALDANPASALRVQQDARLSSTFAALSGQFQVNTVAASGATETLPATHAAHRVTMDQSCEFTFSAPTAGHAFVLYLSGAFTPTWPGSVDWAGGTAPTYAAAGTLYHFVTLDGGTNWLGSGQAYS